MRVTRFTVMLTVALLAGPGCTTNPYTGEQGVSKAAAYGAGAAAVCALVGAAESGKRARNAALGCGIAGAGVGAYMDVQEAKLRAQLEGTGVRVAREGDNLRLVMPGNITFETDSYNLRSDFYPVLNSVGQVVAQYADTTLRVSGHTDNTGSRRYNQELSERRAQSVADYLATRDINRNRMLVQGQGQDAPMAGNDTAEGRSQNRRVELYILPGAV
jgi:outer membrane protein OmpA-like peptidoglycan-associated protein